MHYCSQKKYAVAADILPPKFCRQNIAADIATSAAGAHMCLKRGTISYL